MEACVATSLNNHDHQQRDHNHDHDHDHDAAAPWLDGSGDDDDGGGARVSVAVVGTGLAGLTTAHLLQSDERRRYRVALFEQADALALDAASAVVRNNSTGALTRVDLPMRAFAGGYYANLLRMYRHLAIPVRPLRFLYVFAHAPTPSPHDAPTCPREEAKTPCEAGKAPGSYLVHASNLHRWPTLPMSRPPACVWSRLAELLFLVVCHLWFVAVCFLVPPRTGSHKGGGGGETLADYLERTWVSRRYVSLYLLPLMSSVATCSHAELLAFPAGDVVNYKRLSYGQQHHVVCGGVRRVQTRLARDLSDVCLGARVTSIQPLDGDGHGGLLVRWQKTRGGDVAEERFDRVVLAVPPDVAARLHGPLAAALGGVMPTKRVESSVLSAKPGLLSLVKASRDYDDDDDDDDHDNHDDDDTNDDERASSNPQVITFRTLRAGPASRTQALHAMPGGVLVRTCALEPESEQPEALWTASFTRTLRSPASRDATQRILGGAGDAGWVNGQDGVWVAGAWCWDGMVLLEGCIVSAMRVATDFGVRIPWQGG